MLEDNHVLMSCSFTKQVLAQLDLLRLWKETAPTRTSSISCRFSSTRVHSVFLGLKPTSTGSTATVIER